MSLMLINQSELITLKEKAMATLEEKLMEVTSIQRRLFPTRFYDNDFHRGFTTSFPAGEKDIGTSEHWKALKADSDSLRLQISETRKKLAFYKGLHSIDHNSEIISIYSKDKNILGYIDFIMTHYDEANHESYTNPIRPPREFIELLVKVCRPYYGNPGEDIYYITFPNYEKLFGETYDLTAQAVQSLESLIHKL